MLLLPKTRSEASFFCEKNSREEASSKGWISFFFVNLTECGRLRECRSVIRSLTREEEEVPRSRRVVFGFSTIRGSCFARARFERAFLGLLKGISWRVPEL